MRVTIIADASHCAQTGVGGYGYWIASNRAKKGGGGSFKGEAANNTVAEMKAVVNAVHIAIRENILQSGDELLIQTDSTAAIDAFASKRELKLEEEVHVVKAMKKMLKEIGVIAQFRHVKGHSKRQEARYVTNNLCDARAKEGMRKARTKFKENQHE